MLKPLTKPFSVPPYIQEKTDKELVHFSWSITKTSNISMEHRKYGLFGTTEGRDITLYHSWLRGWRLPHGQMGHSGSGRHYRARRADASWEESDAGRLYLLLDLHSLHGLVPLGHRIWADFQYKKQSQTLTNYEFLVDCNQAALVPILGKTCQLWTGI